jgi:MFS transporter, DHA2 family, multidrug resistance protein
LGGALGVAILGSLAGVVYRSALVRHAPLGVPADALMAAQSTLAAGLAAAARLPAGGELADAARAAFTHCLELTASVAAAIALLLAIVTARALREAPRFT